MLRLSLHAKDIIFTLLEEGYDLRQIQAAMEDGAYLKEADISQELSEEIHSIVLQYPNLKKGKNHDKNFLKKFISIVLSIPKSKKGKKP